MAGAKAQRFITLRIIRRCHGTGPAIIRTAAPSLRLRIILNRGKNAACERTPGADPAHQKDGESLFHVRTKV
jgi:hypothetical protein